MNWFYSFGLVAFAISQVSFGATEETVGGAVYGELDVRPSWSTKAGSVGTEDTIELGYKFANKASVSYVQGILTNLSSPSEVGGLDLKADVGFLRAKIPDIADLGNGTKLHYQVRAYTPTYRPLSDAGMLTYVRNYLTLTNEVVPETLTLSLSEIPSLWVFDKPGFDNKAHPILENRVYLIADVNLTKSLSLSLPLFFVQRKHADFAEGAENNAAWSFELSTWPELVYAVSDSYSVGLAYYSANLVKSDLSQLTLGDGLEKGVVQTIFTARF